MDSNDDADPRRQQENSNLVQEVYNKDPRQIYMTPDRSKGEEAVCNPAIVKEHFFYRVIEKSNNKYMQRSVTKLDGETVLEPEFIYEIDGIEDTRASQKRPKEETSPENPIELIYSAFNENPWLGPRIAYATISKLERDLTGKKIIELTKHGIIGPEIHLSEAVKLAGGPNTFYGSQFARELKGAEDHISGLDPLVMDKDATKAYTPTFKEIMLHRVGNSIQATPIPPLEILKNKKLRRAFWGSKFGQLEEETILRPGEDWAKEKVGLGGTPITILDAWGNPRTIGHVHGVRKEESKSFVKYIYNSTFAEFDPDTFRIIAIMRDPLLNPNEEYILVEKDGDRIVEKYVNFASGLRQNAFNPQIIENFSGCGDTVIEKYINDRDWMLGELSHQHNAIENWKVAA